MTPWFSLYLPSAETESSVLDSADFSESVAATLRDSLMTLGYRLYNPFGLMPGKSYPQTARLFVAPASGNWVRVIGLPDEHLLPILSDKYGVCLWLALDGAEANIAIYAQGEPADYPALAPYLRASSTLDDLKRVLTAPDIQIIEPEATEMPESLPVTLLPDDVQALAGDVDMGQAQKMFNRLTQNLMKRAGQTDDVANAAFDLISGQNAPDWNSAGGGRIRNLMGLLTIQDGWNNPDFTTLRDAYQVHERKQRKPNADLYPGDAEAMAQVMNALDYVPVYAGRNDG